MEEKKLLVIECTPKRDEMEEGVVLRKFLEMTVPKCIRSVRRSSKQELINYLKNKRDLDEFYYVHLSGHGVHDQHVFRTSFGRLAPEDFPKDCFDGKTVTLSACYLGKKGFIEGFVTRTSARYVIAPVRVVDFVDAALWFVTFYYHTLHNGVNPRTAYERTRNSLEKVRGDFRLLP